MLRRKKKILDKIVHIKISEKIIYKKFRKEKVTRHFMSVVFPALKILWGSLLTNVTRLEAPLVFHLIFDTI